MAVTVGCTSSGFNIRRWHSLRMSESPATGRVVACGAGHLVRCRRCSGCCLRVACGCCRLGAAGNAGQHRRWSARSLAVPRWPISLPGFGRANWQVGRFNFNKRRYQCPTGQTVNRGLWVPSRRVHCRPQTLPGDGRYHDPRVPRPFSESVLLAVPLTGLSDPHRRVPRTLATADSADT